MQVTGAVAGQERLGEAFMMAKDAVSPCTKPDLVNASAQESWSMGALLG